jgi:hypothetical protein
MSVEYSVLWYERILINDHAFVSKVDKHHTVKVHFASCKFKNIYTWLVVPEFSFINTLRMSNSVNAMSFSSTPYTYMQLEPHCIVGNTNEMEFNN